MEKLNLTQQKNAFSNQKKCTTTQNKHKKIKPSLVASYDIRPGNGEGLFLFRRFINLSLTYLLRHLLTYLQPRDPHRARFTCNAHVSFTSTISHTCLYFRAAKHHRSLAGIHFSSNWGYKDRLAWVVGFIWRSYTCKWWPISVLAELNVEQLCWFSQHNYH